MKKVVLTLTLSVACLAAFAQGRISFQNDSTRLVYYQNMPGHTNGDAVWLNNSSGLTWMADLYLGTSSTSLSLISSTTFSGTAPGKWNSLNYAAPGIPGGTTVFVVAQVRDSGTTPLPVWVPGTPAYGNYYGASQEFQFILGTSTFTYPAMYNQGTVQGTGNWAPGTQDMSGTFAGFQGAIAVSPVPEPTSMALLGLGTAAMLIFRRRK